MGAAVVVVVGVGATPEEEAAAALVEVVAVASAEPILLLVIIEAASVPQTAAAVIYDDHRHPHCPPSPAQPLLHHYQDQGKTAAAALRVDIPQVTVKHSANTIIIFTIIITVRTNSNVKTVPPKTTQCHYY
jgi:hypothetical protein